MPIEEIKEQYEFSKNDVEMFLDEYYVIDLLKSKEYETRADDIKKDYEKYCEEKGVLSASLPEQY